MAVGPIARLLAQVVVPVIAVLARALPAAYAQALQNARKNGTAAAVNESMNQATTSMNRKLISRQEALLVLNLSEEEATVETIQKQYEKYMKANAVSQGTGSGGGSFYLQSKVYRAHEMLMEYQKEKEENSNSNGSNKSQ